MKAGFLGPLLIRRGVDRPALVNQRTGGVVARRVAMAVDSQSRREGLLKRETFEAGEALVIAPCSAIHTFLMRFAIDVAFVARDGRVLKTCLRVAPWRIAFSARAFAVIELPAGTLDTVPMRRGDVLAFAPAP